MVENSVLFAKATAALAIAMSFSFTVLFQCLLAANARSAVFTEQMEFIAISEPDTAAMAVSLLLTAAMAALLCAIQFDKLYDPVGAAFVRTYSKASPLTFWSFAA